MNHENRRSRRVSGEASIAVPLPTVGVTPARGSKELRLLLATSGRAGRAEYDSPVEKQWRLGIDAANDITDVDNVDRHKDDIDGYENSEEKAVEKDMKLAGRRDKPGNVLVNLDVLLPFLEQNFSCKKCADKGLMSPIVIRHKTMFLDTCLSYTCTVCEVCESAQTAKVTGEIRKRKYATGTLSTTAKLQACKALSQKVQQKQEKR